MFIVRVLRRQFAPLIALPTTCLVLCGAYFILAPPEYAANALIFADMRELEDRDALEPLLFSYVETIRSDEITSQVIDNLPASAPLKIDRGWLGRMFGDIRIKLGFDRHHEISEAEHRTLLVNEVNKDLGVRRIRDTAIIEITYRAPSPQRAADIANVFADTFLDHIAAQSHDTSQQTLDFTRSRIEDLRLLIRASQRQAQDIRSSNGQDRGGFQDLETRISRLTVALSEIDQMQAGLVAQIRLLKEDDDESLEAAALNVDGGAKLYLAYAAAERKLSRLKSGGANQTTLAQIEGSASALREELDRLLQQRLAGLEQELKVVVARRDSIARDLQDDLQLINSPDWSLMQTAESEAATLQNIYADYLRELEAVQKKDLTTPVSVIAPARPNPNPSWPQYKMLFLLAALGGLGIGSVIALWREWDWSAESRTPDGSGSRAALLREEWRHTGTSAAPGYGTGRS